MSRLDRLPRVCAQLPGGTSLELAVAAGPGARLVGLAGLAGLPPGLGLLIPRCASVHTLGMRFAIDVAFVRLAGRSIEVAAVRPDLRPLRVAGARGLRRAEAAALELPEGAADRVGLRQGTLLRLLPP